MPILHGRADGITIAGHTFSALDVRHFVIGTCSISAFLLLSYVILVLSPRIAGRWKCKSPHGATATARVTLKLPAAARLRPDIARPESPFAPRLRPASVKAPPKVLTTGPVSEIYRYSGHWFSGRRPSGPAQIVNKQHRPVHGAQPQAQPSISHAPTVNTLWKSAVRLYQVADVVVGAHPDVRPFLARSAPTDEAMSFPWVSSGNGVAFKFGLVHTLDLTPAPASPVRVKVSPPQPQNSSPTPHFQWGTVIHTLEKPLRGNKLQRTPFDQSGKHNVTTNVVFHKTSLFHTPSAADKENVYGSPEAVRALV